jgi:RNA polymerase sigma-70 factor (ECF subfamily)
MAGKGGGLTDSSSSLELLRCARAGDEEAVQRLYLRYRSRLLTWSRGRLPGWARDAVDTEDLVQDILTRSLRHLQDFEYRNEGAFLAYLRQGLRNRVQDEIRRARRRPEQQSLEGREDPVDDAGALEETIGREALERYEKALAQLKEGDRQAIIARVEMGMSYAEVAAALEKPSPDAARMAVGRALSRLAELMASEA